MDSVAIMVASNILDEKQKMESHGFFVGFEGFLWGVFSRG
jgi:hypothetical protein